MIRITDNHAQRLERMRIERVLPKLGPELKAGADAIGETLRHNMNDGAISGSGHIPGAPGDYAKSDTHKMEQSIRTADVVETPTSISTAALAGDEEAPYSIYVELGHSGVAPRPGMTLAVGENRMDILEALGKAYVEQVNGNG